MSNEICERCKCCSVVYEMVTCWSCGGFCGEDYDDGSDGWDEGWCDVCEAEGEIPVSYCLGQCDEHGKHAHRTAQVEVQVQL